VRSPIVRLVIGLLFAVPAARAGYDVTLPLHTWVFPRNDGGSRSLRLAPCRRQYRLGARVDLDRTRSQTGRCARPSPAADWGDDQGQVTLRVYRLSVGISTDIRSSNMTATSRRFLTLRLSRVISSADYDPVCRCVGIVSCPRSDVWLPFCTPGFLFLRRECGASCVGRSLAGTSPECRSAHASTWPLIGLIWPKAGYASIA